MSHTLLIPTYNRSELLAALLGHLKRSAVGSPIVILDSGADDSKRRNADAVRASGLDCRIVDFASEIPTEKKFFAGLSHVVTPYFSFCADDDLVFVDAVRACVRTLDERPDVIACDGIYLNLDPCRTGTVDVRIEYDGPSAERDDPLGRISNRLDRYAAINYAVMRTAVARATLEPAIPFGRSMFWELFTSLAPLAVGKHIRLDAVYYARRAGQQARIERWHPLAWLADDPEDFFCEFAVYLKRLSSFLVSNGVADATWQRLAYLHSVYLRNECPDRAFKALVDRSFYLEPVVTRRTICEKIRDRLASYRRSREVVQGPMRLSSHLLAQIPELERGLMAAYLTGILPKVCA
jgi:glycosyltransferase domain-containing protein